MGDKCKLMRPKAPRVGDKCEGPVGDKCKHAAQDNQSGRQVWETSANSCGPRHPERETSAEDKWKTSVNRAQGTQSGRQVWETSGRQV